MRAYAVSAQQMNTDVHVVQGKQDNLQSAPSAGSGFGGDAVAPGASAASGGQGQGQAQAQLHQQVCVRQS